MNVRYHLGNNQSNKNILGSLKHLMVEEIFGFTIMALQWFVMIIIS